MPTTPRLPGAGLLPCYPPLVPAGLGFFSEADLGWPPLTMVPPAPARLDSPPLLVAGFNSFNLWIFVISFTGPGIGGVDVSVSHCDPTTNAILVTQAVGNAQPLIAAIIYFGAFASVSGAVTLGNAWNVIRVGLSGVDGDYGVTGSANEKGLLCGTR